jgi:hypothetical protein
MACDAPPSPTTVVALDAHKWGSDQIDPDHLGRFIHVDLGIEGNLLKIDLIGGKGDRRLLVNSDQLRDAFTAAGVPWVAASHDRLDRLTGEGRR